MELARQAKRGVNMSTEGPFKAKYKVVEDHLRQMILNGQLAEGQRLPDEGELARQFHCSRGTVRRAVQSLGADGIVWSRQGLGTFVQGRERQRFIGVIVPNLISPDHSAMVNTLTRRAARKGYTVLLCVVEEGHDTPERVPLERAFIEKMGRMHVAGVVKCPTTVELEAEFRGRLRALGVPCVIINDFWNTCRDAHHVAMDERAAAEMAVAHLADLGHERIALAVLGAPERPNASEAFLRALEARGLRCGEELVLAGQPADRLASQLCPGIRTGDITAIVVTYYWHAQRLWEAIESLGLRVPEDVSIVSLSGVPHAEGSMNEVTATVAPLDEMADRALQLLVATSRTGSANFKAQFIYEPALRVGRTTGPPSGNGELTATPVGSLATAVSTGG